MTGYTIESIINDENGDIRLVADALTAFYNKEETELAHIGSLVLADQYMCLKDLKTYIKGYLGIK